MKKWKKKSEMILKWHGKEKSRTVWRSSGHWLILILEIHPPHQIPRRARLLPTKRQKARPEHRKRRRQLHLRNRVQQIVTPIQFRQFVPGIVDQHRRPSAGFRDYITENASGKKKKQKRRVKKRNHRVSRCKTSSRASQQPPRTILWWWNKLLGNYHLPNKSISKFQVDRPTSAFFVCGFLPLVQQISRKLRRRGPWCNRSGPAVPVREAYVHSHQGILPTGFHL